MENTNRFLSPSASQSRWYFVQENKLTGPVNGTFISDEVLAGRLSLAAFVWKVELANWTRIYDLEEFFILLPHSPSEEVLAEARARESKFAPPPPPKPQEIIEREWFIHEEDKQFGPFSKEEINNLILEGKVRAQTMLWKRSWSGWKSCDTCDEWSERFAPPPLASPTAGPIATAPVSAEATEKIPPNALPPAPPPVTRSVPVPVPVPAKAKPTLPPAPPSSTRSLPVEAPRVHELRATPRKPYEVRVLLTDGQEVGWGACRDISLGGMQVQMGYVPGPVGTELRINVNAYQDIPGFACTGKIVRIADDRRSFSLEFLSLPETAKASLAHYILAGI